MHLRGRVRLGGLLCVLALAALVVSAADAAGPESTHAAASEHGGGGLISLDKSLIVQAVNFVILLLILQRLLYKPFLAKMEERTGAIKRSLEEAQAARAEAAHQAEENATRLRQAHAEAAAIREQALKEAGEEQRRAVESSRAELLEQAPEVNTFFVQPWVPAPAKRAVALELASRLDVSALTRDFLGLVARRGRANYLQKMAEIFQDLVDADVGCVRAKVRTAVALTEADREALRQRLGRALHGKQVELEETVDNGLSGGFVVEVGTYIVDGSLDGQLARLRARLAGG